jgi:hypothetical protein
MSKTKNVITAFLWFLGECLIETGFYVFNTEAHPIDGAALDCCMTLKSQNNEPLKTLFDTIDLKTILERYLDLSTNTEFEVHDIDETENLVEPCVMDGVYKRQPNVSSIVRDSFLCNLNDKFASDFYMISTERSTYT